MTGECETMLEKLNTVLLSETCPRMVLFSVAGQAIGLIVLHWLLGKGRKTEQYILFLVGKAIFTIYFWYGLNLYVPNEPWARMLRVTVSCVLSVLMCLFTIRTYPEEHLKSLFAVLISEAVVSVICIPSIALANWLEGKQDLFEMYSRLQLPDFLLLPLGAAGLAVLWLMGGFLIRRYREVHIHHRQLFWLMFFLYFIVGQLSAVIDVIEQNGAALGFGMAFLALAAMLAAFLFLSYRDYRRQVRQEQQFLTMQFQLLQNHYQSIQTQMSRMEACQKLVDAQMAEIMKMEADMASGANSGQPTDVWNSSASAEKNQENVAECQLLSETKRAKVLQYLQDLREEYQNIRAGMYCSNWMMDAVLYTQTGVAKEHGIAVDCQVQNFSGDTISQETLARLLFEILDFGIRENEQLEAGKERYMRMQIQQVLQQVAIVFETASGAPRRKVRRWVQRMEKEFGIEAEAEQAEHGVRVMVLFP